MYEQSFNPYRGNAAIIKKYFGNGSVLVLGILYIMSAIAGVILTLQLSNTLETYINLIIKNMKKSGETVPQELYTALDSLSGSNTISSVISSIIGPLVIAAAFILIFVMSHSASENKTPHTGLTILYVLSIISLVSLIISVVIIGLVYIIMAVGFSTYIADTSADSADESYVLMAFISIGAALAIVAFVSLFYAVSRKNFYRSARESINSVDLDKRGALPYGVLSILTAVGKLTSLIAVLTLNSILPDHVDHADRIYLPSEEFITSYAFYASVQVLIPVFTAVIAIGYSAYITKHKNGLAGAAVAPAYSGYTNNSAYTDYSGYNNYSGYQSYQAPAPTPTPAPAQNPYASDPDMTQAANPYAVEPDPNVTRAADPYDDNFNR